MCAGWTGVLREWNMPETIYFVASSMYNWFTVLRNCDQVFREGVSAIVITKAADGDERYGGKVLKIVTLLCFWGEGWCERHHHIMCWCHFMVICGKYCGAVICRCYVCACVYVVGAYVISGGACVGDGMRLGWEYGRRVTFCIYFIRYHPTLSGGREPKASFCAPSKRVAK